MFADIDGWTPLLIAARKGFMRVVQHILDKDPGLINQQGESFSGSNLDHSLNASQRRMVGLPSILQPGMAIPE